MRRAVLLVLVLLAPAALAGCLKDVRQQNTNLLLFVDVVETGLIRDFAVLEVALTHARFKPNDTRVEPAGFLIGQHHDLVTIHEAGARKIIESKIQYRVYDEVSIGVNVTNAILTDGTPVKVAVPDDNIYWIQKPFRTRLAGDVAYTFGFDVQRGPNAEGVQEYYIRSAPEISGARSG